MSDTTSSSSPLIVVCLCAQWCGTCRDYRSTFDAVAQDRSDMHFMWVDIEDEADLVDPVEVENFPTLLLAAADGVRFFGTVLPHKDTLVRLLRSHGGADSPRLTAIDPHVESLASRLRLRSDEAQDDR